MILRSPRFWKGWGLGGLLGAALCVAEMGGDQGDPEASRPSEVLSIRRGAANALERFEGESTAHVAFFGGSITEMDGYRPHVMAYLERRFPDTDFRFTNAGIASTGSTTGAFRLGSDVLKEDRPDLLLVDFAVNDDQDEALSRRECIRAMEGIVRRAHRANPAVDLVLLYFVNPSMLETLRSGEVPLTIECHEAVARHYGLPSVNIAAALARRIEAGEWRWKDYGGTHPNAGGSRWSARLVERLLDRAWAQADPSGAEAEVAPHPLPEPLDPFHYGRGRRIPPDEAERGPDWRWEIPDWGRLDGRIRERFESVPLLSTTESGAALRLEFEGTAIGAYILAGPDAGVIKYRIDGGCPARLDLFHRFSEGLHYPRTVLFSRALESGRHTLTLVLLPPVEDERTAVRILQFAVNGPRPAANDGGKDQ